jgi:hypothetical protein
MPLKKLDFSKRCKICDKPRLKYHPEAARGGRLLEQDGSLHKCDQRHLELRRMRGEGRKRV